MPIASEDGEEQMGIEAVRAVPEAEEKADVEAPGSKTETSNDKKDNEKKDNDIEALQTSPGSTSQNASPWANIAPWRKVVVFVGLYLGLFLATLDTSIVATSLVTILTEFNNFSLSPWVVLAYLVAYMSFAIVFARLSDIYGRKNAMLAAWAVFISFSVACAVSKSMIQLIIFRGLQGIGGSGLFSLAMILIPEATPPTKIGLTSGMIGVVLGCSGVLGPILGGLISHLTTWRWIFYLNIPVGGLAIATILLAWPRTRGSSLASGAAFLSIDFLGILLSVSASCLHIYGFETAGSMEEEWSSPPIIAVLLTSACCWISFVAWELYLASRPVTSTSLQPLFPFKIIIKDRVLAAVIVSTFLTGFPFITVVITLPERFQLVNAATPLTAGLHLLPLLAASALGSFIGGALANITKPKPKANPTTSLSETPHSETTPATLPSPPLNITPYTLILSSIFQLLGTGLLSSLTTTSLTIPPRLYAYECILGFGIGLSLSTTTILASVHSTPSTLAAAQGAVAQVRVLGGIVGLTIATTLFNRRSTIALAGRLTTAQMDALRKSPLAALQFGAEEERWVREVYGQFFGLQMRVLMYVCIIGVVVSCAAWEKSGKRRGVHEGLEQHQRDGREAEVEAEDGRP